MKQFVLWICLLSLISCASKQTKEQQVVNDGVVTIDIENGLSNVVPELLLSDAVSVVEVVPLEMTPASLIGEIDKLTDGIEVAASDIFILNGRGNNVLRFTRDGKFLNSVGKIGNGPEEYIRMSNFLIDEERREVCIISCDNGMKVYGYDGTFRRVASRMRLDNFLYTGSSRYLKYEKDYFVNTWLPIIRPVSEVQDSIWSFAIVDSCFNVKRRFYNPAIRGREEEIVGHRSKPETFDAVNYWMEDRTAIDFYAGEFNVMYPGVDSIFRLNVAKDNFVPVYSLALGERPDFEMAHLWLKDRKFFDYLWITDFYETKDYLYFVGSQSEKIYAICYDKQSGEIKSTRRKGEIIETKFPWFKIPHRRIARPFILKDDVCGSGDFNVQFKCKGKYWVAVLYPSKLSETLDMEALKKETVKSESSKQQLLRVLNDMKEEDNPILLIATLKE